MASYGNQKVSVMSHGEVQAAILKMDGKEGDNGKSLGSDDTAGKSAAKVKQADMKGSVAKNGSGQGKFD